MSSASPLCPRPPWSRCTHLNRAVLYVSRRTSKRSSKKRLPRLTVKRAFPPKSCLLSSRNTADIGTACLHQAAGCAGNSPRGALVERKPAGGTWDNPDLGNDWRCWWNIPASGATSTICTTQSPVAFFSAGRDTSSATARRAAFWKCWPFGTHHASTSRGSERGRPSLRPTFRRPAGRCRGAGRAPRCASAAAVPAGRGSKLAAPYPALARELSATISI